MTIRVGLNHVTRYDYDRRVGMGPQIIRLRPAPHARTPVTAYSLKIKPDGHFLNWQQDPHNNWQARVVLPDDVDHFEVEVDLVASMAVFNPFDFFIEEWAEELPFSYPRGLRRDLAPYLEQDLAEADLGPEFADWVKEWQPDGKWRDQRTIDYLVGLNQAIANRLEYVIRMEAGVQTPAFTLSSGSGSCRDSAWLLVQILRALGLAARFCSGYLIQLKPDVKSLDGPSGTDHDFTDLHAWCEVFIPGAGWIGLDTTSGLLCGEGHIPLTASPEPSGASPISGELESCEVSFSHRMTIKRLAEQPRVTRPYTEEQWAEIDALGQQIDLDLKKEDVRLTMGGEPTFVSIDDFQAAEWNTEAVGPTKKALARTLLDKLSARFAPEGMLTFGQGKWYPGESLPRWAYSLLFRVDERPVLLKGLSDEPQPETDLVAGARALGEGIARNLGIDGKYVQSVYEDAWHYMAREQALPDNVTPLDSKLDDPEERERLARVFTQGLNRSRGIVLPLQKQQAEAGSNWMSEIWKTRAGKLVLKPGDSPAGFRLPLDGLPFIPGAAYPRVMMQDPTVERPPLPERTQLSRNGAVDDSTSSHPSPQVLDSGTGAVRTAMAVEAREDRLYVFMPPTETAADYLELSAAIEDAANDLDLPVRIEGYPAPSDPRLQRISVTPDPGVIEVNIHPSGDWETLKQITEGIYEDARQSRLGTEKFLIDGRAVGTGGGNHLVLGGAKTTDSPFIRRPDLLGSLIRYWQNHPSLSYLFSGLFIGPTSQSPRVDEARDDALYELEIALSQLPEPGTDCPPWVVDRTLRHLLTDLSGNTHRSEICIDKLYSPDSATGRLGLVEFRGFEMPPHARMSLTQQLLIRALVCWFWKTPYKGELSRMGTALHDRFLLPEFCWQDFQSVLADLRQAGYDLKDDWFSAHFEFRFPQHGSVVYDGVEMELRHALEPWITLGEEQGGGGTARYVDSSTERMQIKLRGLVGNRYALACNGVRVPLTPTEHAGEFVAGLRFRAWQPWSSLHPSLPADSPLVFDLVDQWSERSVGGITYHVAHPAGRAYDEFPVNAYEAEARKLSRFETRGHTPGHVLKLQTPAITPEFPVTLDLRRQPKHGAG